MQSDATRLERAALAQRFFNEINDNFDSIASLGDEHGTRTLGDLFYMQAALLTGGYIDAWPSSKVLTVIDTLASASTWRRFISIYDENGDCVHECEAAQATSAPADPMVRDIARDVAAACLSRLRGRSIERLATCNYFTVDYEGDELVVADQHGRPAASLFDEIERVAGAKLTLRPDLGTPMCLVLGFDQADAASVLERLS